MKKLMVICLLVMAAATVASAMASEKNTRPFVLVGTFPTDAESADVVLSDEDEGGEVYYIKIEVPNLRVSNVGTISLVCHAAWDDAEELVANHSGYVQINMEEKFVIIQYGREEYDWETGEWFFRPSFSGQYILRIER